MSFNFLVFTSPLSERKYYIRPDYVKLTEIILKTREQALDVTDHYGLGVRITGTPRIGKSVFLHYVAKILKENNIRFVITLDTLSYDDNFIKRDFNSLRETLLANFRVVHLIDPSKDPFYLCEHNAFAVFFTSPTINNIEPYHLKNLLTLYMPLWSEEEMTECYEVLEQPFDRKLYEKWGGVILDSVRDLFMEKSLCEVLNHKELLALLSAKEKSTLSENIIHNQWLLHRYPTSDYTDQTIHLPTDYVRNAILEKLKSGVTFNLSLAEGNSLVAGELYESAVFTHVTQQQCFEVFRSDGRTHQESRKITFNNVRVYTNRDIFCFCNVPDHQPQHQEQTVGTYYKPKEKNKQGVDAVLITSSKEGWIIQITINSRHNSLDLSNVPKQFENIQKWNVCCFIPTEIKDFRFPSITGLDIDLRSRYISNFSLIVNTVMN